MDQEEALRMQNQRLADEEFFNAYDDQGLYSYGGSSGSHVPQEQRPQGEAEAVEEDRGHEPLELIGHTTIKSMKLGNIPGCCGSSFMANRPLACLAIGAVFLIIFLGAGLGTTLPLKIEASFDSFLETDTDASQRNAAFTNAQNSRGLDVNRRLQESAAVYATYDLYVAYELKSRDDGLGVMGTKVMGQIVDFERTLRNQAAYASFCKTTDPAFNQLCSSGLSMANYVLPTQDLQGSIVPSSLIIDGNGFDAVPLRTAFFLASKHSLLNLFFPEDWSYQVTNGSSKLLRSLFRFRINVGNVTDSTSMIKQKTAASAQMWSDFFENVVVPVFHDTSTGSRLTTLSQSVNVWYGGTDFQGFEVYRALIGDIYLAVLSNVFTFLYTLSHIRSVFLSLVSLFLCLVSVPMAFILCAAFSGTSTINFSYFLSVFLIIGFGSDVTFLFTDFFFASATFVDEKDLPSRLAWTFNRTIRPSFACSMTTAFSFLCNLASTVRALRGFGLFMGLCVILCWFMLVWIYGAALVVDELYFERFRLDRIVCRRKPDYDPEKPTWSTRLFAGWSWLMHRCRFFVVLLTIALFALCLGLAIPKAQLQQGVPKLFPTDHTQNRGSDVFAAFKPLGDAFESQSPEPPHQAKVCSDTDFSTPPSQCALYWCEAVSQLSFPETWPGSGACKCSRRDLPSCGSALLAPVTLRFVGAGPALGTNQIQNNIAAHIISDARDQGLTWIGDSTSGTSRLSSSSTMLPQMLLQVWETGDTALESVSQVGINLLRNDVSTSGCGWQETCFCAGALTCTMNGFYNVGMISIMPNRRLDEADEKNNTIQEASPATRQLARVISTVDEVNQIRIKVVFGITADLSLKVLGDKKPEDTWSFTQGFDMSDPWMQRKMYYFCRNTPLELKVAYVWCWFEDFRDFARASKGRFPVKAIDWQATSMKFVDTSDSATGGTRYVWLDGGAVRAMYYYFEANLNAYTASMQEVSDLQARWDTYVEEVKIKEAFHVSASWVKVEGQKEIIATTIASVGLLIGSAGIIVLFFTRSAALSGIVVTSTIFVVVVLAFVIIVILEWKIGLVEIIAFIYFAGYAMDYSIQIIYNYSVDEATRKQDLPAWHETAPYAAVRYQRTTFSLKSMGTATFGSAASTAGAAFFLLFCTITVFVKLGAMCLIVCLASLLISFAPLSTVLMLCAPIRPGKCRGYDPCGSVDNSIVQAIFGTQRNLRDETS